jgi:hypothetical protein
MKIYPANQETFNALKGQNFTPHAGEGLVYVKLVALKPSTLLAEPQSVCENAEGVVTVGNLQEIKQQFNSWLDALIEEYSK